MSTRTEETAQTPLDSVIIMGRTALAKLTASGRTSADVARARRMVGHLETAIAVAERTPVGQPILAALNLRITIAGAVDQADRQIAAAQASPAGPLAFPFKLGPGTKLGAASV